MDDGGRGEVVVGEDDSVEGNEDDDREDEENVDFECDALDAAADCGNAEDVEEDNI